MTRDMAPDCKWIVPIDEEVRMKHDEYALYDLLVEVVPSPDGRPMICPHRAGDTLTLTHDDKIGLPPGQTFPLYPLAMLLPLLSGKQRAFQEADWMYTDSVIACPDPNCGGMFKITRGERRLFRHSEMTHVPMEKEAGE